MLTARRIGGLMALATLLALVAADTVSATITLDSGDKLLLVSIVSALLGVDIVTKRGDVLGSALGAALDELASNGGSDDDDG